MTSVTFSEIASSSLSLYREALPSLARRVLPLLAGGEAIDFLPQSIPSPLLVISALCSWLLIAWANALALLVVLEIHFPTKLNSLSAVSFALVVLSGAYITATTSLAILFFVLPALIVVSATTLAPVFALQHRQGPFEAAASSAECTKGSLLPICAVVFVFWLALIFVTVIVGFAAEFSGAASPAVGYVGNIGLEFAGFFYYAIAVVLFERLSPKAALQGALREHGTARLNSDL